MLARRDTSLSVSPGPCVPLQQDVCEIAPLRALADQFDLRRALDRHLILDEGRDLLRGRARQLRQRRTAVAEYPRIPVLVGAERVGDLHLGQQAPQRFHRVCLRRVLRIVGDMVDACVRLRVLALEARDEHPALALGVEHEGDRSLGGREREAGVVEDVVRVEEHRAGELVARRRCSASAASRCSYSGCVIARLIGLFLADERGKGRQGKPCGFPFSCSSAHAAISAARGLRRHLKKGAREGNMVSLTGASHRRATVMRRGASHASPDPARAAAARVHRRADASRTAPPGRPRETG